MCKDYAHMQPPPSSGETCNSLLGRMDELPPLGAELTLRSDAGDVRATVTEVSVDRWRARWSAGPAVLVGTWALDGRLIGVRVVGFVATSIVP